MTSKTNPNKTYLYFNHVDEINEGFIICIFIIIMTVKTDPNQFEEYEVTYGNDNHPMKVKTNIAIVNECNYACSI